MSSVLRTIRTTAIVCLSSTLLMACGAGGGGELPGTVEAVNDTVIGTADGNGTGEQTSIASPETETASTITKSLKLTWPAPSKRANGNDMDLSEVAGYDIQYRKVGEAIFTSTIINSPYKMQIILTDLDVGDYEIKMASFDTDKRYGQFSDPATVTL